MYVHNAPNPTPNHPFSWPELEKGQNELLSEGVTVWATSTPTGQYARSGTFFFVLEYCIFRKANVHVYLRRFLSES